MDKTVEEPNTIENQEVGEKTVEEVAETLFDKSKNEVEQSPDEKDKKEGEEENSQESEEKPEDSEETKDGDEQEEKAAEDDNEIIVELSKDSPLDESFVEAVVDYAKENGLSKEQAQEILLHKEDAVIDYLEDSKERSKIQADKWVDEIMSDPKLGGQNFEESQALARKPLNDDRLVSPEDRPVLMEFLKESNLDKHPIFFKMLRGMGLAMSDDRFVQSSTPARRPKTPEELFYGDKAAKE